MPGVGMVHGAPPAWEIFISAAKDGGDGFVVPLHRARVQNAKANARKRHAKASARQPPQAGASAPPTEPLEVPQGMRKSTLVPRRKLYSVRTMGQLPPVITGMGSGAVKMGRIGRSHVPVDLAMGGGIDLPRPPSHAPSRPLGSPAYAPVAAPPAPPAPKPASDGAAAAPPPPASPPPAPLEKDAAAAETHASRPPSSMASRNASLSSVPAGGGGGARRGSYAQYRRQSVRASVRFLPVMDPFDREVRLPPDTHRS